jgi:hypothetical protein
MRTNDSYIPSTIRQWNNLDLSIRNVGSMPHFKSELKKLSNSYSVNIPKYYSYGPRKVSHPRSRNIKLEFAKTGRPVTILAASSCSLSNLLAFTDPQLSQTSEAYSNIKSISRLKII